jgi:hypothetical protein
MLQSNGSLPLVGWTVYNNMTIDPHALRIHHIPKTAGTSLRYDLNRHLGLSIPHTECCFHDRPDMVQVTMFREPRAHVLSQYLECRFDSWGQRATRGSAFPRSHDVETDFVSWLKHMKTSPDNFGCYHPYNMQVRSLMSSCRNSHAYLELEKDTWKWVQSKISAKHLLAFGITEDYTTSLCVIEYRISGRLPSWCECDKRSGASITHVRHGVPHQSVSNLTGSTQLLIDAFVEQDQLLYATITEMYEREVAVVEDQLGMTLRCGGK